MWMELGKFAHFGMDLYEAPQNWGGEPSGKTLSLSEEEPPGPILGSFRRRDSVGCRNREMVCE